MPAETPAEKLQQRAALFLALAMLGTMLSDCELFQRTEPRASSDVIDAIVQGMKRAQQRPG